MWVRSRRHSLGERMIRRAALGLMLMLVLVANAAPASAHQDPPGCMGNGLRLDILRDRSVVRVGETVAYRVYASNDGLDACTVTNAAIYVQLPGADGQPVPEAQAT